MSIRQTTKLGGIAIVGALGLAIVVGTWSINEIRLGGKLYKEDQLISDLEADTASPANFIVEPWLEASLVAGGHGSLDQHLARIAELRKIYEERTAWWGKQDIPASARQELAEAGKAAGTFWDVYDNELLPAARANDWARMEAVRDKLGAAFDEHRKHIDELVATTATFRKEVLDRNGRTQAWSIALMAALAAAIVALVALSVRTLLKRVLAPVIDTAGVMDRMAAGDLEAGRTSTHRDDEIGDMTRALEVFREASIAQRGAEHRTRAVVEQLSGALKELAEGNLAHRMDQPLATEFEELRSSYNKAVDQLGGLLQDVASVARTVASGAGEIRAASNDLALRNEQQAASLEEAAAAMNEVTTTVRESAERTVGVQAMIANAHAEATNGGKVVSNAITAMAAIEKSAQEITQIINVIDGIAFQTNLLALNAGVEAARAGDAGKGFAVVANEVRALAQRSADAAKDIKELITASTEQVAGGVRLVGETGDLLGTIVTRVGEIDEVITEIARSTEGQASNLLQVNSVVSEMDRMTQQNAAMVEQSTAAARSLADDARGLAELVGRFRTGAEVSAALPARKVETGPRRARAVPAPLPVAGNLAVAASFQPDADDWSEF